MRLIECRNCDETDCTGCNLHRLAFALRRGLFEACKDDHNAVCITSEVVPVVRCKECKHRYVDGDNVRYNVCELNHNRVQSDDWFCADGKRKDGDGE